MPEVLVARPATACVRYLVGAPLIRVASLACRSDNIDKHLTNVELLKHLPKDYVFLNYEYEIKGRTLSTFHRDVTSSQYEFNTK